MPFALVNAPATFQAMMNSIFQEFLDHGVVVYLDDITIYSRTMEEHEALLKQVLARLQRHDLAVSLKKVSVPCRDSRISKRHRGKKQSHYERKESCEFPQLESPTVSKGHTNLDWFCKYLSTIQ